MIGNIALQTKIATLKNERAKIVEEKLRLSGLIKEMKITKQAAWKHNTGKSDKIDSEVLKLRNHYSTHLVKVETQIKAINDQLRELYRQQDAEENNQLMAIFKEMFSHEQLQAIGEEARSRMRGNPPAPLGINLSRNEEYKEKYYTYRKLAQEQLEQTIKFRIMLTGMIEKGCEKWGNGEFLSFISPLNKLIIPLKELEKIKQTHLL